MSTVPFAPTCVSCGASIAPTPAGFVSAAHSNPGLCVASSSMAHAPVELVVAA